MNDATQTTFVDTLRTLREQLDAAIQTPLKFPPSLSYQEATVEEHGRKARARLVNRDVKGARIYIQKAEALERAHNLLDTHLWKQALDTATELLAKEAKQPEPMPPLPAPVETPELRGLTGDESRYLRDLDTADNLALVAEIDVKKMKAALNGQARLPVAIIERLLALQPTPKPVLAPVVVLPPPTPAAPPPPPEDLCERCLHNRECLEEPACPGTSRCDGCRGPFLRLTAGLCPKCSAKKSAASAPKTAPTPKPAPAVSSILFEDRTSVQALTAEEVVAVLIRMHTDREFYELTGAVLKKGGYL